MQTNRIIIVVTLAYALLAGGISFAFAVGALQPKTDGASVYEYITQTNPYQQWSLFPDKGKFYTGKHPHGALLTTYVNDHALNGIESKAGTLADGAIIVKENYMPDKSLGAITVMYRVAGYDPEGGDWFWAKYAAGGSIDKEGKVSGCINCHAAVIHNDWVFTGPVK